MNHLSLDHEADPVAERNAAPVPFDFEGFYRRTRRRLLYAAFRMLRDWQRAEDVTQETYLALLGKVSEGHIRFSPWSWVQTAAYFRCLRVLGPWGERHVPIEQGRLAGILDQAAGAAARCPGLDAFEALVADEEGWEGLVFWSRRILEVATAGASPRHRVRLAALVRAQDRNRALAELRRDGDRWNTSSVSMMLARDSARVDEHLARLVAAGPSSGEEKLHWPVLLELWRVWPGHGPKVCRSTLSWLLRLFHSLEPDRRRELVEHVFGSGSATGV
jgi:DNA-directed RNA polymerase specialized sigma24 family protein